MSRKTKPPTLPPEIAAVIRSQAETIRHLTEALARSAAPAAENSPLPSTADHATIETMKQAKTLPPVNIRRRGVPLASTGPIARVANKLDVSVAEVARRLGENYQSVRTWDARNRVPEDVQVKLASLLKTSKPGR